jgi:polysaccharide pyruvyl transferase CsaB
MVIGLIGNYGATNSGDDAILSAILQSHPDHRFVVFSANPEETRAQCGVDSAPLFPLGFRSLRRFGIRRSFSALKSADVVILGGGGLFQDRRLFACFLWAWQVFWVKWLSKPLFIYATGVGPLTTRVGRFLTKWAYQYASGITVRDVQSKDLLLSLGLAPDNIEVTADPAFLLGAPAMELSRAPHTYTISIRPWMEHNPKIVQAFSEFLLNLKNEKKAILQFVCMQQIKEHDRQVLDPLMRRVGGALVVPKDFSDLIRVLSESEFAIGMRYHFLIAALIAKTPLMAVSYSPKIDSLFEGTSLETYRMPVETLDAAEMIKVSRRLSVDYNNLRIYEKKRAEFLKEKALLNIVYFDDFIKTLTANSETAKVNEQKV